MFSFVSEYEGETDERRADGERWPSHPPVQFMEATTVPSALAIW
jgi:hypothetical protein